MDLIQNKFICPHCFESAPLSGVMFRCQSEPQVCAPQADAELGKFQRQATAPVMPRVFAPPPPMGRVKVNLRGFMVPPKARCPNCNNDSTMKVCPVCHSQLPYLLGRYKEMFIAVIGAKETGKSHYIAALVDIIKNQVGEEFDCVLEAVDDATLDRYKNDFYKPVVVDRTIIKATRSARDDFSVRIPLIYTLNFTGKNLRGKTRIKKVVTVTFFDTAGEDMDSQDTISTENKYIFHSSGILVLVDPLQLPDVREQLPSSVDLPQMNSEIDDIITRTANLIRQARGMRGTSQIKIPVAVALSKIDALDPLLDPSSALLRDSTSGSGKLDLADIEAVNTEVQAHLRSWKGTYLKRQVEKNFTDYCFFGLTALGCNPHGGGSIDRFQPRRVQDSFLWLLYKNGLIKGG